LSATPPPPFEVAVHLTAGNPFLFLFVPRIPCRQEFLPPFAEHRGLSFPSKHDSSEPFLGHSILWRFFSRGSRSPLPSFKPKAGVFFCLNGGYPSFDFCVAIHPVPPPFFAAFSLGTNQRSWYDAITVQFLLVESALNSPFSC